MAGRIATFYDIGKSVGAGGLNNTSDVMLIQFFLFSIFLNSGFPIPAQFGQDQVLDPTAIFPINGVPKPELNRWISMFQRLTNKTSQGPLVVDGRVDPGNVGWGLRSGRTAGRKTIMVFNQLLLNGDRDRFERIPTDPNMPASLGNTLKLGTST